MNKEEIEKEKCAICEEEFDEGTLIETEGMVNGGVGKVCEQCLQDNDIE